MRPDPWRRPKGSRTLGTRLISAKTDLVLVIGSDWFLIQISFTNQAKHPVLGRIQSDGLLAQYMALGADTCRLRGIISAEINSNKHRKMTDQSRQDWWSVSHYNR